MGLHIFSSRKEVPQSLSRKAQLGDPQWIELIGLIKSISIFLAIAFMLRASVVEAFKIPSSSMEPTLEIGDHILVNKLSYGLRLPMVQETVVEFRKPKRGDVVVFTLPDNPKTPDITESNTNIIKRIVGLPGDVIEVKQMEVFINGEKLSEEYARWLQGGKKDFGPVEIPPGRVLLLGDNRDYSKDSRYWTDPFLETGRIKGRAFIIYWNYQHWLQRMFNVIR